MSDFIEILGANEHNLKNVSLKIPRNQLVVFTGLSGSGKSSLAFDTLYAEGQRRYIESFSAYARQFLGGLKRPDVERVIGLSPVVSIEQKTTSKSPRSTVGTTTELYDFLRLLYARLADAYSINTGELMVKLSDDEINSKIVADFKGDNVSILVPLVKGRKGHYRELFERLGKQGFLRVRVDGGIFEIEKGMKLDRYKIHDIDLILDRVKVESESIRLKSSLDQALKKGKGTVSILSQKGKEKFYSRHLMCPTTGISYPEPEPNLFSFNSPYGACHKCKGLGELKRINSDHIIKNKSLSILEGGLNLTGTNKKSWFLREIVEGLIDLDIDPRKKIKDFTSKELNLILEGDESDFRGAIEIQSEVIVEKNKEELNELLDVQTCPKCKGKRLKNLSLQFKILDKDISDISSYSLVELQDWLQKFKESVSVSRKQVADEILKEILNKVQFLLDVGLHYLSLDRPMKTLSGGEAQRIRLATQIGSKLVGILYILDEPSIGLHQRDNTRLIKSLKELRDLGNSVLVVEHDEEIIGESDYLVDIGPKAGANGGHIVYAGLPKDADKGITADFLRGKNKIEIPEKRRKSKQFIELKGATGNNLNNANLKIPLGVLTCVTGVSGSGKSTLVNNTLVPLLYNEYYHSKRKVLPYKSIKGLEHLDKVIQVDQSPIGRTPRSNPATYTGVFSHIRKLFAEIPESKIRGYKLGRFSFNVKGGRCEECKGAGLKTIEMNFLPDVNVNCDVCQGKRYNRETLEVRFKGKSITDVLNMSIENAETFFDSHPKIKRILKALNDVGLGYISLGQASTTLSGGEAQRVKLATELAKKDTGNTMYVLDEPTTGLHFYDIKTLLEILHNLVDKGNSVVVIEHNLDVVKTADHLIDLGPDGGVNGGNIVFEGVPEKIASSKESITGPYLLKTLNG
jgi:excinuclease ABC subunit A